MFVQHVHRSIYTEYTVYDDIRSTMKRFASRLSVEVFVSHSSIARPFPFSMENHCFSHNINVMADGKRRQTHLSSDNATKRHKKHLFFTKTIRILKTEDINFTCETPIFPYPRTISKKINKYWLLSTEGTDLGQHKKFHINYYWLEWAEAFFRRKPYSSTILVILLYLQWKVNRIEFEIFGFCVHTTL